MLNSYENGDLRVLDFETLVKYVRLSWFKRLFTSENAGWKCYLLSRLNLLEIFFFCTVTMILRIITYQINSMLS